MNTDIKSGFLSVSICVHPWLLLFHWLCSKIMDDLVRVSGTLEVPSKTKFRHDYRRRPRMTLRNTSIKQVTCSLLLITFCICSFATSTISAQTVEFVDKYNKKFLKKEPKIGDTIKEVSVFDDQGKPMKLSSAQGKYTVLIFGCLT